MEQVAEIRLVTAELLRQVSEEARRSPRLRRNHNFHPTDDSRCHRLLNAIEPGSYIRPHRHLDPEKAEAFVLMSGRLGIITFRDDGSVAGSVVLDRDTGPFAADIPPGIYHTAVSLGTGTVFYEAKAGPYLPLSGEEKASWAPAEDDLRAPDYLKQLTGIFPA